MFQRHATDVISLVFGTLFAGLTVAWLLVVSDVIHIEDAGVAGPVILIVARTAGLIAALRPSNADAPPTAEAPVDLEH